MFQMLKNKLKDQKGFTLIELLAVIVILGIIAAIAVPSILNILDNSKKDAHLANAKQMVSSAKLALAQVEDLRPAIPASTATEPNYKFVNLKYLEDNGYVDTIKDPESGAAYTAADDAKTATSNFSTAPTAAGECFVRIGVDKSGKQSFAVTLKGSKKHIGSVSAPEDINGLDRSKVQ